MSPHFYYSQPLFLLLIEREREIGRESLAERREDGGRLIVRRPVAVVPDLVVSTVKGIAMVAVCGWNGGKRWLHQQPFLQRCWAENEAAVVALEVRWPVAARATTTITANYHHCHRYSKVFPSTLLPPLCKHPTETNNIEAGEFDLIISLCVVCGSEMWEMGNCQAAEVVTMVIQHPGNKMATLVVLIEAMIPLPRPPASLGPQLGSHFTKHFSSSKPNHAKCTYFSQPLLT